MGATRLITGGSCMAMLAFDSGLFLVMQDRVDCAPIPESAGARRSHPSPPGVHSVAGTSLNPASSGGRAALRAPSADGGGPERERIPVSPRRVYLLSAPRVPEAR